MVLLTLVCKLFLWKLSVMTMIPRTPKNTLSRNLEKMVP